MQTVLHWLERSARRLPNKLAVADPDSELTFAELLHTAQSIGTWLATQAQVGPGTAVALYLEKSPLALAALLGVAYAGGYYSFIDVRQPAKRVLSVCATLSPAVVFTDRLNQQEAQDIFSATSLEPTLLEEVAATDPDLDLLDAIQAAAVDVDPLYVNFTSGSTGTPKGVVVSQRSVIDFIPEFVGAFGISEDDVIANQAPFDFDVSVKDIYSALLTGATLRLVPRTHFSNPTLLMDYLCDCEATTLTWAVSALCFVSIMGGFDYRVPTHVRRVLFSGEVMPLKQLALWRKNLPNALFVNLYGPTEVTCNCTYYVVDAASEPEGTLPMGKAFRNERVLLLDENDRLIDPSNADAIGEVCVSGTCLALGYLNDHDRTAEAFVPNPLNTGWPETLYRTGDLARYNGQGDLVFVSRKDHQIKHLGQRIELGEIEAAAEGVEGVTRACCLYDSERKRIILFYTGLLERKELKRHLRVALPAYMVPNNTKQLDEMPLNKNGKIDRGVLASLARIKR